MVTIGPEKRSSGIGQPAEGAHRQDEFRRLGDEMISEYVAARQAEGDPRDAQAIAVEYNDTVIYPDKVRLNCYYYRHYSFVKDIQMVFCTVLGRKMLFAGEGGVMIVMH